MSEAFTTQLANDPAGLTTQASGSTQSTPTRPSVTYATWQSTDKSGHESYLFRKLTSQAPLIVLSAILGSLYFGFVQPHLLPGSIMWSWVALFFLFGLINIAIRRRQWEKTDSAGYGREALPCSITLYRKGFPYAFDEGHVVFVDEFLLYQGQAVTFSFTNQHVSPLPKATFNSSSLIPHPFARRLRYRFEADGKTFVIEFATCFNRIHFSNRFESWDRRLTAFDRLDVLPPVVPRQMALDYLKLDAKVSRVCFVIMTSILCLGVLYGFHQQGLVILTVFIVPAVMYSNIFKIYRLQAPRINELERDLR